DWAPSDGPNMAPLADMAKMLKRLKEIDRLMKD
ncbi:MAG TPA: 3-deoxy-8-phosphooctulonate synthase, partial [Rhodobacteraceae bacterium]|nr:3-deoxy-8-phosphooctulonate synthase [Paracoccaceae bacterium]